MRRRNCTNDEREEESRHRDKLPQWESHSEDMDIGIRSVLQRYQHEGDQKWPPKISTESWPGAVGEDVSEVWYSLEHDANRNNRSFVWKDDTGAQRDPEDC